MNIINWLKAKIALLIIATVWLSLIVVCLPLMLVVLVYDKRANEDINWLYSLFIAQDYLVSAILGNHHNTTISALLGHLKSQKSKTGTLVATVVDKLFYLARKEVNHCTNAMRVTDVYRFSAARAFLGFICYAVGMVLVYFGVVFHIFFNTVFS